LAASGDPLGADFSNLLDELILHPIPSNISTQEAIQQQEQIEEFEQKLALLSGMVQQAQIAMDSQEPLPDGMQSPAAQAYYFAKSQLAQVGLPGQVLDVV
jgi:hypothetical protein